MAHGVLYAVQSTAAQACLLFLACAIGVACTEVGILEADCAVADNDEAGVVCDLGVVN